MRRLALSALLALIPLGPLAAQDSPPAPETDTAQESRDVGLIADFIETRLSSLTREVRIDGFDGALSSRATIESLTVADREGVWLQLEDLVLDWDRAALLRGRVQVQELTAGRIAVLRQPLPDPMAPSSESSPLRIPELPVSISIGALQAERIELGADILGEPFAAQLWGDAQLADGSLDASFNALRTDDKTGQFITDLVFDKEAGHLAITLIANEAEDGLAARLLNLPGRPSVRLEVIGFGPIEDFIASIALETDDTPRLTGSAQLIQTDGTPTELGLDLSGDLSALFSPEYGVFFGGQSQLSAHALAPPEGGLRVTDLTLDTAGLDLSGDLAVGPNGWPTHFALTGQIAPGADPVLLPLSGPRTTIGSADLSLIYDGAQSPDWSANLILRNLHRRGLTLPLADLSGGGTIVPPAAQPGTWSADLTYGAYDITLRNAGLSEALGDAITGVIKAHGGSDQPSVIEQITLTGPGLEAEASGQVQGRDGDFASHFDARIEGRALERFSGLAGRAVSGELALDIAADLNPIAGTTRLTVAGDTDDIAIGDARIDPLLAGPGVISIEAARSPTGTRLPVFDIHTDHARIEAQAELTHDQAQALLIAAIPDATLLSPDLEGAARITGTLARGADQIAQIDLAADLPGAVSRVKARVQPRTQDYASWINGTINATGLDLYADLLGREISGAAVVNVVGNVQPLSSAFGLAFSAQTDDLQLGEAQIDPLLRGPGFLSAAALRDAAGRLSLSGLNVATQELSATGSASLQGTAITADFDAHLRDFAVLSPDLSGPMQITGTAAQTEAGGTHADLSATAPGLDLTVDATLAPLSEDPARSLATRYDVTVTAEDLHRYAGLIGRDLSGAIDGHIQGTAAPKVQAFDARIDAQTQDLALGIPMLDGLLAGAGHLKSRAARRADGAILIEGLDAQTPQLRAAGDLTLAPGDVSADLTARLEDLARLLPGLPGPAELSVTSSAAPEGGTRLRLRGDGPGLSLSGDARIDETDPALPARFTLTGTVPRLSALRALVGLPLAGSARIEADGEARITEATGTADLTAYTTDLAIGTDAVDHLLRGSGQIRALASRDDAGTLAIRALSATFPNLRAGADATLQAGTLSADFTAMLPDLGQVSPQLAGRLTAAGRARVAPGGRTDLDVTASGDGGLSARVAGDLSGGQADLAITGAVPLAMANRALSPQALSGRALLDLRMRGAPGLDAISGTVQIEDGRLSEPDSGQMVEQIAGQITLSGPSAQLALSAAPTAGGRLTVDGSVTLSGAYPADLNITATDVILRDPTLFETTANGHVTLRGPVQGGALIAGRIVLNETEIRVPSAGAATLGALPEVRHDGAPTPVQQTLRRAGLSIAGIDLRRGGSASSGEGARAQTSFPLDLVIAAPSRIFIRGRGLDAELGGSLTLRGTTRAIIPSGRFELIRGRIDILQQRFDLTEGFATLEGDFSPWLKLVALTETDEGGTASIIVEGDASAPEIRFESQPELPEDEVLSRLIFGRDLSALSPLQAVRLAMAVNTLMGRGGAGIVERMRDQIGLDDLDVTSDDEGRTAVTAGKYIGENAYTNVTVASDGTSRIDLNLDLSDDLTLRGGTATDGESSLGVFFERDY